MDAALALEKTKGVGAGYAQGNALDSRFIAAQKVHLFNLVAVVGGPAVIHAQQHFGPVL